jgi:hypothetical protein
MSIHKLPEPPYRRELNQLAAEHAQRSRQAGELVVRDVLGNEHTVILSERWQMLPGHMGVRIYHLADPNGAPGLYLLAFLIEAGSSYAGGLLAESRLLTVLQGRLVCNGRHYRPGECFWLPADVPTNWQALETTVLVARYGVPMPDSLLPDSESNNDY